MSEQFEWKVPTTYFEPYFNLSVYKAAPIMYETIKELLRRDEFGSIRLPTQASDALKKSVSKIEGK